MEKSDKKRILTRVLIVIAALTLLSCCFLGSTFARYVTNADGSGTVGVAKWDVSVTTSASGSYTFTKLSPDMAADGTEGDRTNSTDSVTLLTVTNSSDVSAKVEYNVASFTPNWKTGYNSGEQEGNYEKWGGLFNTIFSISVSVDSGHTDMVLDAKQSSTEPDSLTLTATVTWKTVNDEVDTWYGQWLESITVKINYTAYQNSELPTA